MPVEAQSRCSDIYTLRQTAGKASRSKVSSCINVVAGLGGGEFLVSLGASRSLKRVHQGAYTNRWCRLLGCIKARRVLKFLDQGVESSWLHQGYFKSMTQVAGQFVIDVNQTGERSISTPCSEQGHFNSQHKARWVIERSR